MCQPNAKNDTARAKSTCAYCYTAVTSPTKCGKCHKRVFCSEECQKLDWKAGHGHYCGIEGEANVDWEIREVEGKGLGLFALRDFRKDEKVMVERPVLGPGHNNFSEELSVLYARRNRVDQAVLDAVDTLSPRGTDSTIQEKIDINTFQVAKKGGGLVLYINVSRMNHSCVPNTIHRYSNGRNVGLLVAARKIKKGDEIVISYCPKMPRDHAKFKLVMIYGFRCRCPACTNTEIDAELHEIFLLEKDIRFLPDTPSETSPAMEKAYRLLFLYQKHHFSSWYYQWLYYIMFQIQILGRTTAEHADFYIRKAYNAALGFTSDDQEAVLVEYKQYMEDPSSHQFYLEHER